MTETTTKPARVRVAPSPTGDPHVGTAYMALFNKALADTTGGQFILRIEDTDRARYVADSEAQIFEALAWLGLNPDEGPPEHGPGGEYGPYRQSERTEQYVEAAERLIAEGKAYRCFCTSDRLSALRKIQQAEKSKRVGYDGLCRGLTPEEIAKNEDDGVPSVVRFKMPREGEIRCEDFFRGTVSFIAEEQQDAVLLKSDGYPTYHLANIVDDHAMGVTHVIRAEEWIPSLPLHVELYKAFGWDAPVFAHMPLLRNNDKSKISKRKNPTSLLWYRNAGFLPEALRNFLSLMGFSMADDQEVFGYDEFLTQFKLEKVNVGGPIFDLRKLHWLNGEWIRRLSAEELGKRLVGYCEQMVAHPDRFQTVAEDDLPQEQFLRDFMQKQNAWFAKLKPFAQTVIDNAGNLGPVIPLIQERMHTLAEAADYLPMFFTSDFDYAPEDFVPKKQTPEGALAAVKAMREILAERDFDADDFVESLDPITRDKAKELGVKLGPFLGPVRVAITGSRVSPPMMESMKVLGRDEVLSRLDKAISFLEA